MKRKLADAEARNAASERDAGRYRFLLRRVSYAQKMSGNHHWYLSTVGVPLVGPTFDGAIDAAIDALCGPITSDEAWGALDRMEAQMRRARDRRKVHRGQHSPESVHAAMSRSEASWSEPEAGEEAVSERKVGPVTVTGDGPLVVREKTFPATPITAEQALYEMELVGHDFYLFVDKESDKPSVVYRRKGYDYGLISLDLS